MLPEAGCGLKVAFGLELHLSLPSFTVPGAGLVHCLSRKRSSLLEQVLTEPLATPEWPSQPHRWLGCML